MKKLYFLFFTILISGLSFGQTTVLQESFETDGNGSRYSTSVPEFTDGTGGDFFTRTDGTTTTVPSYYEVSGQEGSYYFAAMDTNGDAQPAILTLDFTGVDISTYSNMTFAIMAAEDDASDGLEDWDADASVLVEINIDGAGFTKLIQFSSGGGTNTEPGLDTDFDGIADGPALSPNFQEFTAPIGTGTSADIKITFTNLESGDEDIAIDNIRIIDGYIANPTLTLDNGPANGTVFIGNPEDVNAGISFITTNFNLSNDAGSGVSDGSGDGYIAAEIRDTSDNSLVIAANIFTSNDGFEYDIPGLSVNNTYTLFAELVDNSGNSLVPAVTYTLTITIPAYIDVPDLATLRSQTIDPDTYYRVTGEVINTYSRANRNQKYFQDATGGILVDDLDGEVFSIYNEGDGVTNIRGHLSDYNGLLEFVPTPADWGVPTSTGNAVTIPTVDIATLSSNWNDYESELVRINGVTFADGDGVETFISSTDYSISDGNSMNFRTAFYEADYIGEFIPTGSTNIVGIVGEYSGVPYVTARSLSELTLSTKNNQIKGFAMYPNPTSLGYVKLLSINNAPMTVSVFDLLGKQVLHKAVKNNTLDVSSLKTGLYLMKVSQDNASITKKLVVQ